MFAACPTGKSGEGTGDSWSAGPVTRRGCQAARRSAVSWLPALQMGIHWPGHERATERSKCDD